VIFLGDLHITPFPPTPSPFSPFHMENRIWGGKRQGLKEKLQDLGIYPPHM